MLKGVPNNLCSGLIKALADMGHGDLLVLADHFYPAESKGKNGLVIQAKGNRVPEMLDSILKLIPLDSEYTAFPIEIMRPDPDCEGMLKTSPPVWADIIAVVENNEPNAHVGFISRTAFYEKAEHACVTVSTSEEQPYGCVILRKGVR